MNCLPPEDWNPNKPVRKGLKDMGYEFYDTCRGGKTMYETWFNKKENTYVMVQYRWNQSHGWVPFLVSSSPMTECAAT